MAIKTVEQVVCDVCSEPIPEPFRPQVCGLCKKVMCLKHAWRIEISKAIPDDPNRPYAGGISVCVCEICKGNIIPPTPRDLK